MGKSNYIFKGLGYAYIITLAVLLVYNLFLTFTDIGGDNITMVSSFITTISATIGGFYTSKHMKEKGLMYGLLVGLLYIVCIFLTVFLAQEKFVFEIGMIYKLLLISAAGGIGGVLGVNFK
ncbi:TPA: TIGR04086 family membrane protein [Clostridioides difficile]|nr:TIGR04086 family membrane protein [Clostridioides difficile]MDV9867177.1 TIGR04086 family membrane protein [Clostridioides difficile]HBG8587491.1 TIGR04086 family membrane protein [Clostridioides difficile]HBH0644604.1 TIGR04086 family membrane protein [Clostridioides difficile]HBH0719513.1 TIGR04086 family membrane protein [Clostridioides difficile]